LLPERFHWILLLCSLLVISSFYRFLFRPGTERKIDYSSNNYDNDWDYWEAKDSDGVNGNNSNSNSNSNSNGNGNGNGNSNGTSTSNGTSNVVVFEGEPPIEASSEVVLQPSASFDIPVHNESSYVSSDISRILHVPAESRIEVHLKPKSVRRCQNPIF